MVRGLRRHSAQVLAVIFPLLLTVLGLPFAFFGAAPPSLAEEPGSTTELQQAMLDQPTYEAESPLVHLIFLLEASNDVPEETFSELRDSLFAGVTLLRAQDSLSVLLCRDFVSRQISQASVARSEEVIREVKGIMQIGRSEWFGCLSKALDEARLGGAGNPTDQPNTVFVAVTTTAMRSQHPAGVERLLTALADQDLRVVSLSESESKLRAPLPAPRSARVVAISDRRNLQRAVEQVIKPRRSPQPTSERQQ